MMTPAALIPCLRYRDPRAAMEPLCRVFGLRKHLVVDGSDGRLEHAELSGESCMIMLSGIDPEGQFDQLVRQPEEVGGFETQNTYIVVKDVEAVYTKAKSEAGWSIRMDLRAEDYGGLSFTCADAEGHLWSVGSYDPWASLPPTC